MTKIIISTRRYGEGYIARAHGFGIQASSTMSALWAARRCAMRCKLGRKAEVNTNDWDSAGITLDPVADGTYLASYESTQSTPSN